MSTSELQSTPPPSTPDPGLPPAVLVAFLRYTQPIGYALMAIALALFILLGVVLARLGFSAYPGLSIWLASFALFLGIFGLWVAFGTEQGRLDQARVAVLSLGAISGIMIAVFGCGMLYNQASFLFSSAPAGKNDPSPRYIVIGGVTVLVGLTVTFLTLLVGRGEERRNATIRRLLYGYNAVLTLILLGVLLAVVNVLAALTLPPAVDFTASGINSINLDPKGSTVQVVKNLSRPVTVYILMPVSDQTTDQVRLLLGHFARLNNKISYEMVPLQKADPKAQDILKKYPGKITSPGLLVTNGSGPADARFIPRTELERNVSDDPEQSRFVFQGETKLLTALDSLERVGPPTGVLFTQGNGEPPLMEGRRSRFSLLGQPTISELPGYLRQYEIDAKPINVGPEKPGTTNYAESLKSAKIVVVTVTNNPLPEPFLVALRSFLDLPDDKGKPPAEKQNGRLLTLLGPTASPRGLIGLDRILQDLQIETRPLRQISTKEDAVLPTGEPITLRNPIVNAYGSGEGDADVLGLSFQDTAIPLYEPHEIRPAANATPSPSGLRASTFLVTRGSVLALEANQRPTLDSVVQTPLPVGAVVTEGSDPKASGDARTARAVVIGSMSLIIDDPETNPSGQVGKDLFLSVINRLRQSNHIGVEPDLTPAYKVPKDYTGFGMVYGPLLLMLTGVAVVGGLVWVVRRN